MQGFNMGRYVPPDLEGLTSGNALHQKHPLGARANKIAQGVLTVRFEMPFPVWCLTCPKPTIIGQGVRFNAEKKKTGSYYTTPIWTFRMKHAACGGAIEIRTDPKNTAYVVVSGARRRDTGEDEVREGEFRIVTEQEREALRRSAFASLEKTIEDRAQLAQAKERLDDLAAESARHWDDPYARNQSLRRAFRIGRKEREREAAATEGLRDRMSLGIELLPGTEVDAKRAALVEFGSSTEADGAHRALAKPLFAAKEGRATRSACGKPRPGAEDARRKGTIVSEILGNTRVAQDPFLSAHRGPDVPKTQTKLAGIKRKRTTEEERDEEQLRERPGEADLPAATGLVEYDSD